MRKFRLLFILAFWLPGIVHADYSATLNPRTTFGTWEGWGVSLCWWANVFGSRDDLADIVFTTNSTSLNGTVLPGLAMNIARYNVGACTTNTINGSTMQATTNFAAFKQMEGYWLNWFSSDPASASWRWTADASQRAMLQKAKARGANRLELFSNAPLWWMCYNSNPAGAANGANDNLQSWNYQSHAAYLATVAKYASDNWGITFDSVEAFNEPVATWWNANGTQEGCHFNAGTQAAVIGYLRTELDSRGLTNTLVAASDESYYDQALSTWNAFSATTQAQIGEVNVHGYQYGGGRRDLLYAAVAGKRLWNTEYGEADATGISLAQNLILDFRWLHPTAWCYWQPFDSGGWGLVQSNPGDNWIGTPNPKYYVLAQFTRHIRPGMTIIDGTDGNTVAAYNAAARKLILVTMNYGTAQTIAYNLTNFFRASGPVRRWLTMTGTGVKYQPYNDTAITNRSFSSYFATNTVQTFEIQNVDLDSPPLLTLARRVSDQQVVMSWPQSAAGYHLYAATNLTPPVTWQTVTNAPVGTNSNWQVVLPTTGSQTRFYRLANP